MYNIPTPSKKKESKLVSNLKGLFYAIVIALIIRIAVIEPYKIPSESMYPNIFKGDMIMANKFIYGIFFPVINLKLDIVSSPKESDVALFQTPTYSTPGKIREFFNFITFGIFMLDNNENNPKFFIKRVVGAPGNALSIVDPQQNQYQYQLVINGEKRLLNPVKNVQDFDGANDYLFYIEESDGKDHIVQFKKESQPLFGFLDTGFKGNVYVPKDGDILEFRMVVQKEKVASIKQAKEMGMIPNLHPQDQVKLSVFKKESKNKINKEQEMIISVAALKTFYYTQKEPNKLLTDKDIYDLLLNGVVRVTSEYDYYLMMGDNRDNSSDSRYWGLVSDKYLIGNPLLRYFPFSRFGSVNKGVTQ